MNSTMYKINSKDVAKGLAMAVISAVLTWVLQAIDAPGFSVYAIDWNEIGRIAMVAGLGYITKNFFSDKQGSFMGRIG